MYETNSFLVFNFHVCINYHILHCTSYGCTCKEICGMLLMKCIEFSTDTLGRNGDKNRQKIRVTAPTLVISVCLYDHRRLQNVTVFFRAPKFFQWNFLKKYEVVTILTTLSRKIVKTHNFDCHRNKTFV